MTCERPYALFAILLIIPIILFIMFHNKKNEITVDKQLSMHNRKIGKKRLFNYSKLSKIKALLFCCAWTMMICSYAKFSWGTYIVPIQKNGTCVSFVFDISNSMMAKDGPNKTTRLQAATIYAKKLMEQMENISISVVLAKGEGVIAVPITEDYLMIESLLDVLNPTLMTTPGSSIGKGILKAKESFSQNYSNAARIWVFTDGEETDNTLKTSLTECIKFGIPVSIIGFGKENESSIIAGDGVTKVNSALRSKKITETINSVQKSMALYKRQVQNIYINSEEKSSAYKLLNQLTKSDEQIISYETKTVPRYKLFLFLSVLFFALGFVITEFDLSKFFMDLKKTSVSAIVFSSFMLCSCSSDTTQMFKGVYAFNQRQYSHAISLFLELSEKASKENNMQVYDFALYNLATTYAKLEEDNSATKKYSEISNYAQQKVLFSAFYNTGVIAYKNGDYTEATECFKKALKIDSSNINAKINMELSVLHSEVNMNQAKSSEPIAAQEDEDKSINLEKTIFQRIKENDQKQWKSNEPDTQQNLSMDY